MAVATCIKLSHLYLPPSFIHPRKQQGLMINANRSSGIFHWPDGQKNLSDRTTFISYPISTEEDRTKCRWWLVVNEKHWNEDKYDYRIAHSLLHSRKSQRYDPRPVSPDNIPIAFILSFHCCKYRIFHLQRTFIVAVQRTRNPQRYKRIAAVEQSFRYYALSEQWPLVLKFLRDSQSYRRTHSSTGEQC